MPETLFPPRYPVRLLKNVHIPMSDGTRIAADLHLPDAPGRFPVIMEYLPYRKDDVMAYRQQRHYYFAERGFATAWIDIRGTGASAGIATDEYSRQEHDDACEIIAWLAGQPWSNGNVGMTGISYGGFNSIQIAMRRPPALKAIIPAYATDDRYTDDVHFYGGALRALDQLEYPLFMVAMNALPPHAEVVGTDWATLWEEHLKNEPWLLRWLEEQVDGDYWRYGSLRPQYETIEAATLLIGGWSDYYRNWPLRMFSQLRCPKRVLMGPWGHQWPNVAYPGPQIDYLEECVRWFGYWLAGVDTGVLNEPPVALYVQHSRPPTPSVVEAPGTWRAEHSWPFPGTSTSTLYLGNGSLTGSVPQEEQRDMFEHLATVGMSAPFAMMGGHGPGAQPTDQRADEAFSLVYTTPPLEQDLEVIGHPQMVLYASATAEVAFFSVKLCDVAPDGCSTFVTRGLLNATRRNSLREPEPLVPGQVYELHIELDCCAWVFPAGHRLRIAIAGSDWPNIWPAPYSSTHSVYHGPVHSSRLELPLAPAAHLPAPVFALPTPLRTLAPLEEGRGAVFQVSEQVPEQTVTVHHESGLTQTILPFDNTTLTEHASYDLTASRLNPARASARGKHTYVLRGLHGEISSEALVNITSDQAYFHVIVNLTIHVNGVFHRQRSWTRTIPRKLL